ncbi:probable ribosome biogenesis protein RLP24 [Oscarella lobularis]|uniref:probable ribosome biogenesis protein RLP24 n=1 Tax=Oscarella lobularis TaxID=121494 RepID=UPI0033137C8D
MRLEKCFFCSSTVYPGHGIQFVRNDSKIFRFCRAKCHKAFKKKRNPRRVRWTKAHRKTAGKELAVDHSLEFEMKRNVPVKYRRHLWKQTMGAMKRIEDIKLKRQKHYIRKRLKAGKELAKEEDVKEVEKNIHLLAPPITKVQRKAKEPEAMEIVIPEKQSIAKERN